jgi:hypothetical protein
MRPLIDQGLTLSYYTCFVRGPRRTRRRRLHEKLGGLVTVTGNRQAPIGSRLETLGVELTTVVCEGLLWHVTEGPK